MTCEIGMPRSTAFCRNTSRASEDIDIHFYRVDGNGPPLILSHGWPGSVFEFLHIIDALSKNFTVVVPSLPGYGFSNRWRNPRGPSVRARSRACSTR